MTSARMTTAPILETRVHVLLTILWTYLTAVYAWCLRIQLA